MNLGTAAPRSLIESVWLFIKSVKVGVALLILIALAAIAGTVIESKTDTATAQKLVYHSVWFSVLMGITILNLVAATWSNTLITLALPWSRPLVDNPRAFKMMGEMREFDSIQNVEAVKQAMQRRIGNVSGEGSGLFAQSGIIQRWGAIISHIGVVLLLGGGVFLTVWFYLQGPPGGAVLWLGEGMESGTYLVPSREEPDTSVPADMPFRVLLYDFDADYFPNTGIPRAFTSTVELITPNGESSTHRINMTEALRWRGFKLSQSGFLILDDSMDQGMGRYLSRRDGSQFANLIRNGRLAIQLVNTQTGERTPIFDADVGLKVPIPQSQMMFETPDGNSFRLLSGDTVIASGPLDNLNGDSHAAGHNHTWAIRIDDFYPNYSRGPEGHGTMGTNLGNPALAWTLISDGAPMGSDVAFNSENFRGMSFTDLPVTVAFEAYEPADLAEWNPGDPITFQLTVRLPESEEGFETPALTLGETWDLPSENDEAEPASQPVAQPTEDIPTVGPYAAAVVGSIPGSYTALAVSRESNSLKYFFYLSFVLFLAGPFLSFTTAHMRVWAWVDTASKKVWIGGNARGRRAKLTHALDQIESELRKVKR